MDKVPRPRVEIETPQSDRHEQSVRPQRHVVFVIHGIRTQAEWATRLVELNEDTGRESDRVEATPVAEVTPVADNVAATGSFTSMR